MSFARETVSMVGKIGVALSVFAALAATVFIYTDETNVAAKAEHMLKNGVVVAATPTFASSSTRTGRRGFSSATHRIDYAFMDAQGRRFNGTHSATESELSALVDPGRPGTIRASARVDVVYDRANPRDNGMKSRFEKQRSMDYSTIAIYAAVALGIGLLITAFVYGFMERRVVPAPTATPEPDWQRRRAA